MPPTDTPKFWQFKNMLINLRSIVYVQNGCEEKFKDITVKTKATEYKHYISYDTPDECNAVYMRLSKAPAGYDRK